jgi:AcrR family transcriptional regulator
MPRLSSKDRYIREVFELYKRRGLNLSMEQIAEELRITKKTLYNNFASKEEMVRTVVDYFFYSLEKKMFESLMNSANAIESMISISNTIRCEIDKLGVLLLNDLTGDNIDLFAHSNRSSFYSKVIRENLQKGMAENLYRKNIDVEYVTLFYTSAIELFYKKSKSNTYIKSAIIL